MLNQKASFYKEFEDYLNVYVSEIETLLEQKSIEFNKLNEQINDILDENPRLRKYLEDERIVNFSYKECKLLRKVLGYYFTRSLLIEKEIFFKGVGDGIWLLRRADVIKDGSDI